LQHLGQAPVAEHLTQPLASLERAEIKNLGDHPIGVAQ
jgi:hypothetical protein